MAQPQTHDVSNPEDIWGVNIKWCQGVGPGFWPTKGSGLTLNLSAGTSFIGSTRCDYAGGTLSLTDNATNYVFLDTTASNAPAFNTSGYPTTGIPIATVATASGAITTITDDRTWFAAASSPNTGVYSVAGITIDGGASTPVTGSKGYLEIPFACTITGWSLIADQSGSAQITVKKCANGSFPTTASIVASAPPAIAGAQKAESTALTGWTTAIAAKDILEFNLDSATTVQRLTLELTLTRS